MNNIALNTCHDDVCDVTAQPELRQGLVARLVTRLAALLGWLKQAHAVHRQRRALAKLSADQLRDIGVSRVDAHREAARSFWDYA